MKPDAAPRSLPCPYLGFRSRPHPPLLDRLWPRLAAEPVKLLEPAVPYCISSGSKDCIFGFQGLQVGVVNADVNSTQIVRAKLVCASPMQCVARALRYAGHGQTACTALVMWYNISAIRQCRPYVDASLVSALRGTWVVLLPLFRQSSATTIQKWHVMMYDLQIQMYIPPEKIQQLFAQNYFKFFGWRGVTTGDMCNQLETISNNYFVWLAAAETTDFSMFI